MLNNQQLIQQKPQLILKKQQINPDIIPQAKTLKQDQIRKEYFDFHLKESDDFYEDSIKRDLIIASSKSQKEAQENISKEHASRSEYFLKSSFKKRGNSKPYEKKQTNKYQQLTFQDQKKSYELLSSQRNNNNNSLLNFQIVPDSLSKAIIYSHVRNIQTQKFNAKPPPQLIEIIDEKNDSSVQHQKSVKNKSYTEHHQVSLLPILKEHVKTGKSVNPCLINSIEVSQEGLQQDFSKVIINTEGNSSPFKNQRLEHIQESNSKPNGTQKQAMSYTSYNADLFPQQQQQQQSIIEVDTSQQHNQFFDLISTNNGININYHKKNKRATVNNNGNLNLNKFVFKTKFQQAAQGGGFLTKRYLQQKQGEFIEIQVVIVKELQPFFAYLKELKFFNINLTDLSWTMAQQLSKEPIKSNESGVEYYSDKPGDPITGSKHLSANYLEGYKGDAFFRKTIMIRNKKFFLLQSKDSFGQQSCKAAAYTATASTSACTGSSSTPSQFQQQQLYTQLPYKPMKNILNQYYETASILLASCNNDFKSSYQVPAFPDPFKEPYKFVYSSNFKQITDFAEIPDDCNLLIITKHQLDDYLSAIRKEIIEKQNASQQKKQMSLSALFNYKSNLKSFTNDEITKSQMNNSELQQRSKPKLFSFNFEDSHQQSQSQQQQQQQQHQASSSTCSYYSNSRQHYKQKLQYKQTQVNNNKSALQQQQDFPLSKSIPLTAIEIQQSHSENIGFIIPSSIVGNKYSPHQIKKQNYYSPFKNHIPSLNVTIYKLNQQSLEKSQNSPVNKSSQVQKKPFVLTEKIINRLHILINDNVFKQNLIKFLLIKYKIPNFRSISENIYQDIFWDYSKEELDKMFSEFLVLSEVSCRFLESNIDQWLSQNTKQSTKISEMFNSQLFVYLSLLKEHFSFLKRVQFKVLISIISFISDIDDIKIPKLNKKKKTPNNGNKQSNNNNSIANNNSNDKGSKPFKPYAQQDLKEVSTIQIESSETFQEQEFDYQEYQEEWQSVKIKWLHFLRFKSYFVDFKWSKEEKISFILNTINPDQDEFFDQTQLKALLINCNSKKPRQFQQFLDYVSQTDYLNQHLQAPFCRLEDIVKREVYLSVNDLVSSLLCIQN